jgi:enoyl-CoA hydratase
VDYSHYRRLKIEKEGRLARVTLNRPERLNALDRQFHVELSEIFTDLTEDTEVSAILLTGAGDAFCVGGDIKGLAERPHGDFVLEGEAIDPGNQRRMWNRMLDCDKPIVCAINGHCIGLGASLALLCDITVASNTAKIADTHVKVGSPCGDGGAVIWPLLIGFSKAKEYLMRGTIMTGVEAERIGLVNYSVPKEEVLGKALEIARELAEGPALAIRWTKLSVNKVLKERMNLVFDASYALGLLSTHTADHKEAVSAFLEKRKGVFVGR